MTKIKKFSVLLFNLFAVIFLITVQVNAQSPNQDTQTAPPPIMKEANVLPDLMMREATHPEKIIFSQLKLAGAKPDLDAFSAASPIVKRAQDIDKDVMIISEYNRLQNSFSLLDPREEIIIHTRLEADEYSNLQNLIVFDELNESTFFRYSLYDYNIGIVPQDIANFSRLELSKKRADIFFSALSGSQDVTAEFILKPAHSDITTPFVLNDKEYWLMLARIGEFRLWSDRDPDDAKLLWFYRAPWYQNTSDSDSKIGDLYDVGS